VDGIILDRHRESGYIEPVLRNSIACAPYMLSHEQTLSVKVFTVSDGLTKDADRDSILARTL